MMDQRGICLINTHALDRIVTLFSIIIYLFNHFLTSFSSLIMQLFFHKAVQNDTLFLSIVNVVDYSILVGFDENTHEVVVGIIDYMRQVNTLFILVCNVIVFSCVFRWYGEEELAVMLTFKYFA